MRFALWETRSVSEVSSPIGRGRLDSRDLTRACQWRMETALQVICDRENDNLVLVAKQSLGDLLILFSIIAIK